ncbi:MAG: ATP-dependent Clp protease proteolytic subunit, partial [Desulfobacterales bacterium]
MLKKVIFFFVMGIFLVSCATVPTTSSPAKAPQEIVVKVKAAEPTKVTVEDGQKERVNKSMEVPNPEGRLSQLSFISSDKAFVKIFSGLSVADVTRLWNDLVVLENNTKIRDVNLFINSPGGDAFSGLALADQIERAR